MSPYRRTGEEVGVSHSPLTGYPEFAGPVDVVRNAQLSRNVRHRAGAGAVGAAGWGELAAEETDTGEGRYLEELSHEKEAATENDTSRGS